MEKWKTTMSEHATLIAIHVALFLLQIVAAALVVTVSKELVILNPIIGAAQAFFPNPWKGV